MRKKANREASQHQHIEQTIRRILTELTAAGVRSMGPTTIAVRTYTEYSNPNDEPHIRYASIEHFKQMARAILARQYDPNGGDESEAYQGDLFSGHLQRMYPIPRESDDDEPLYKPRELLSLSELDWNIVALRKSADARLHHADALEAYRDRRRAA